MFTNPVFWTLFIIAWVALAFWPARVAGRKGHSFIGYFLFSLLFFPAALITAYLVKDRLATPNTPATRTTTPRAAAA
ncbi:MAG TPA: hypothetical protein VMT88_13440 [Actinomycetes bacterium]|nr:hypothetical protein [Actinomycetes bacterium]